MGLRKFSDTPTTITPATITAPNPNPYRFSILQILTSGQDACALEVVYPDCTTFEGRKILVYALPYSKVSRLMIRQGLDPHFSSERSTEDKLFPVARFEPSTLGRTFAVLMADKMNGKQ